MPLPAGLKKNPAEEWPCAAYISDKQRSPSGAFPIEAALGADSRPLTHQLCSSAKAALIFFTELSTSSLIITRYLVRDTVQRCKSFTDFSIFGPKMNVKKKNVCF